ncbi:hypothetical protein VKT23_020792 [Stygiomarasmius scandens]|uniref:Uncharacterized protein n=1 Tax=Marasmiellus scandens TaxID=2682957 RepID=A0ABR1J7I2_9AGAR
MSLELTLRDLVKNRNTKQPITFKDGLSAAIYQRTSEFITSPNRQSIPCPPFGSTRDLYRRSDSRYGEDDPLQWPQPYNKNNYYLTCIPLRPQSPDDLYHELECLWYNATENDMSLAGSLTPKNGVISPLFLHPFSLAVEYIRNRSGPLITKSQAENSVLELLSEFDTTMTICMTRLSSTPSPYRDLQRGVVELQRACLYTIALMDYLQVYRPRMQGPNTVDAPDIADSRMGAFVWNDADALSLFKAGLPTYYVRHFNDFSTQNILTTCTLLPSSLCLSASSPPYPILFSGQAGADDKFAAIRVASTGCYDVESPFQNMHLPGAYSSSFQIGSRPITSYADSRPSASTSTGPTRNHLQVSSSSAPYSKVKQRGNKAKAKALNPPKLQRDKFADLPSNNPYVPSTISTWKNVNKSINVDHPGKRLTTTPPNVSILPEPGLFFGTEDGARQSIYLSQWAHVRDVWLQSCRDGQEPLKVSVWRKIMSMSIMGMWNNDMEPKNTQSAEHQFASNLLRSLFKRYGSGRPAVFVSGPAPSSEAGRALIREISVLSFRHQLVSLDQVADTSRPQPSHAISQAELKVSLANHRRGRVMLVDTILGGGGDMFSLPSYSNVGVTAERWHDRFPALLGFWQLMNSWPDPKPATWGRGEDKNLASMVSAGEEWERCLAEFYVQSYYNFFGYPPVLPRRL